MYNVRKKRATNTCKYVNVLIWEHFTQNRLKTICDLVLKLSLFQRTFTFRGAKESKLKLTN